MSRTPNLVLIGFMGTGKSSVGRRCAELMGFVYHDSDRWISRQAEMSIPDIFSQEGEESFRAREQVVIRELCGRSAIVLATGGGAVLEPENRRLLRESGVVVLLTATPDAIFERVIDNPSRPLLRTADPRASISDLLAAREPIYLATSHAQVDTTDRFRDEVAEEVIAIYRKAVA